MKLERTTEEHLRDLTTRITLTATASRSYIATHEQLERGGDQIAEQINHELLRNIRTAAIDTLGLGDNIDEALLMLRRTIEALLNVLEPNASDHYAAQLDATFEAAKAAMTR